MERMLRGLKEIPGLRLYGISDPARLESRCPTFAIRIDGHTPLELATKLGFPAVSTTPAWLPSGSTIHPPTMSSALRTLAAALYSPDGFPTMGIVKECTTAL